MWPPERLNFSARPRGEPSDVGFVQAMECHGRKERPAFHACCPWLITPGSAPSGAKVTIPLNGFSQARQPLARRMSSGVRQLGL